MCQVRTGAYAPLLAPGKTDCTACRRRKTTTYLLHVVLITTHTHVRRKSNGKRQNKKRRKRKGREGKGREGKGREGKGREGKGNKRNTSRPQELTKDSIRLIEGIKCIINGTGERMTHDDKVTAALR